MKAQTLSFIQWWWQHRACRTCEIFKVRIGKWYPQLCDKPKQNTLTFCDDL